MTSDNNDFTKNPVEITIKIAMTLLLFIWCFYIVQPFIIPLVWALIITVSIFPVYKRLLLLFRGRQKLTAVLITFCLLVIIVVPFVVLGGTIASSAESLARQLSDGTLSIPLPTEKVASWPLVGETLHKYWTLIATNPMDALKPIVPQIKMAGQWLISSGFSLTISIFQLIMAIIISGVLLANAEDCHRLALAISRRFVGAKGVKFERMSEQTIRSVANGVLVVAIIQSLLVGLGFWVADVPAAALLTLVCFFLAVIQVGPGPVVIPVAIYVFSFHDTLFSLVYLVWAVFAGLIDNVLRPLLMGRGSSIPMVIIFIGAIGGMIFSGFIGLFIGAVVLALGYELFRAWVFEEQ
ncbi:MAG: AI-2E family transporter [Methylococcales bacterium]|nr:AI-2E family transporter [Methylococcales bacterium]